MTVKALSISLDGYVAGPSQSQKNPLGIRGEELHHWRFPPDKAPVTGVDKDFADRSFDNLGSWILGRNMFGPVRGPWPDDNWRGWWGQNPPYHVPVFVLTHHARKPLEMEGGTTFHFVTGGIHEALERAREAAGDRDIRIGGGASTVRQYLEARLIDELHITVAPILLGSGEPLFANLDLSALGYSCTAQIAGDRTVHYLIEKSTTQEG